MGAVQYIGTGRLGASQDVACSAFGTQTYKVRLVATTDCRIRISDGTPTAVATDTYLPALAAEYFTVTPGQKVAAIQVSSAGTLNVTEGFVMAFGRLGAGDFGRLGLKAIAARLASLLLRDGSSHLLLRNGSGFLLLGH
jgi:hypothetical protein